MLGILLCTWLALSPDGSRISVSWEQDGAVFHFDTRTGQPTEGNSAARRVTPRTAVAPDGTELSATALPAQNAIADHVAAKVCFNGSGCLLLPNGSTNVQGVAISPDGRWGFVIHILARYTVHTTQLEQGWINTNAVSIIDMPRRSLHATFLLDDVDNGAANPWAVTVSPDSQTLYVTTAGTHELHVINLPALLARIASYEGEPANRLSFLLDIRERIALPGKGPRALAADDGGVWVAEYFTRTLAHVTPGGIRRAGGKPREMTRIEQGEMWFHDAALCFQRWQSCASCHPGARADGLNWDLMNDGIGNPKNTKSLVNSHKLPPVMWTGVRPSAEYAVRSGMRHIQFSEPDEEMAGAIDIYLKSLEPQPGPVDDPAAAERGRKLFFSAEVGCVACHPKPLYTDNQLHDTGTHGRFDFALDKDGNRIPQTKFKTPSLLEAWRTAPYLHDGRYSTLREVISEGNHGDLRGRTSQLSSSQLDDLAAFVRSL